MNGSRGAKNEKEAKKEEKEINSPTEGQKQKVARKKIV